MDRFAPHAVNLGNFLRALGVYLPYLVFSTFLSTFIPEQYVGFVFTGAALCTGAVVLMAPVLFRRLRTHRVLFAASFVAALSLVGLSLAENAVQVIALFIIAYASGWTVALSLDVILEKIVGSREEETGFSRALFLTASNIGAAIASVIIAATLTNGDYWRIFIIAAGSYLACAYLSVRFFANIPHVEHKSIRIREAYQSAVGNPSLSAVVGAHLLLQFLFVWMAVYIPLYLHNHADLSWGAIGILFSLSMLPYIILQVPVGRFADQVVGEKEFIVAGFLLSAASFASFFFGGFEFATLSVIMLGLGTGGALLEIATESYFFKKVNASDSELIGVFRALRQFAVIIGPLFGSVALFFIPLGTLFLVFGALMLLGIPLALSIKDTR